MFSLKVIFVGELLDGVLVVRLRGRVLERPERAGLTEASLLPELLVVEGGAVRSRHRQLAGLLVGKLGEDVVLEPLDVLPAELVQVPDAVVVQPLGVQAQHLDDGHRAGVEPLREDTKRSRVAATQGGDQVCCRHVQARDAVLRRAVHFFYSLLIRVLTQTYVVCARPGGGGTR